MPTPKTGIILDIFNEKRDRTTNTLSDSIVLLTDVVRAIERHNLLYPDNQLSSRNPANFFKDFIRNRNSANTNWPAEVLAAGYTARQVTGRNACFEFVQLPENQSEAFPPANFAEPTANTPLHKIESVSLPLASRRLGRKDEPWLIQVAARLRIVETHFSLFSGRQVRQIDLLQLNVKLSNTEIDAIYLAHEETEGGVFEEVIITCEAKVGRDDILEDQIIKQAKAPFTMRSITQHRVIPIAVKVVEDSKIYVVEFQEFTRETFSTIESLTIACDSLFEIHPPVPGI
jgi:hypothetical protein